FLLLTPLGGADFIHLNERHVNARTNFDGYCAVEVIPQLLLRVPSYCFVVARADFKSMITGDLRQWIDVIIARRVEIHTETSSRNRVAKTIVNHDIIVAKLNFLHLERLRNADYGGNAQQSNCQKFCQQSIAVYSLHHPSVLQACRARSSTDPRPNTSDNRNKPLH